MHSTAALQKLPPAHGARQGTFHAAFYAPYASAACSLLPILCAARSSLCRQYGGDPVKSITFRLKSPASIREKLRKKGLPAIESAASAALHDIAGMRVVLPGIEDVYAYASLVKSSPGVECFGEHDYIARPKASGYQSLHLLLRVPVCAGSEALMVPVELQLRTAAMDVWANIEHALCYKPAHPAP